MSLEQTSQTKETSQLDYKQILTEVSSDTSSQKRVGIQSGSSKSERALVSESTVSRASAQKANIAFNLSFSIPLTSIIPTNSNC